MNFVRTCGVIPAFSLSCSSPSPSPSGPPISFSVSSPLGAASFACGGGEIEPASADGGLWVLCDLTGVGADGGASPTSASVRLTSYEGSGVYAFQGSDDSTVSGVQFGIGDCDFWSQAGTPASLATSCIVTVNGPASLTPGARVMGVFHCDNIYTSPGSGLSVTVGVSAFRGCSSAGPTLVLTSVDGQFVGEVP
jgi:hypothetical protein